MKLWDWITDWVLPLFGELPITPIDMGQLGTWTIEQMLAVMFWLALGYLYFFHCIQLATWNLLTISKCRIKNK